MTFPATALEGDHALLKYLMSSKFKSLLINRGYRPLDVPSLIREGTLIKQGMIDCSIATSIGDGFYLSGSAEQGILQLFEDRYIESKLPYKKLFAHNQCYRKEGRYIKDRWCLEFDKIEQFVFCTEKNWKVYFNECLDNVTSFLNHFNFEYRVVDTDDEGYHHFKKDIEVMTNDGWLETNSCLYYAEEHSKRFKFSGLTHTIACTGLAFPRIMIPVIEGRVDIEKFYD